MDQREYLDTASTASLTGISRSTLEKWRVYGGGIPFIRAGRLIRYARHDIIEWMQARRLESTSQVADLSTRSATRLPRPDRYPNACDCGAAGVEP